MSAVAWSSVCDRVDLVKSSKRRRSITVRPTRRASRNRRVTRSTRPTSTASSGWRPFAATARGRAAIRSTGAAARCGPGGRRGCGTRAWMWWPDARSEDRHERRPRASPRCRRPWCDAAGVELRRRLGADAPDPLDRQRVQEPELVVGRHDEQAVRLGHGAGDLGEELRAGDPDADRQADALAHLPTQARRRSPPVCRRSGAGRRRRGTPRRPRSPRRTGSCRRRPRTPPGWPRCRRTGAARRTRRPGTGAAPRRRPSPRARRGPGPRSWRTSRRRYRRSIGRAHAGSGRRAARRRRRTRRGRRGGSSPRPSRTYVRRRGRRGQREVSSRIRLPAEAQRRDRLPDSPGRGNPAPPPRRRDQAVSGRHRPR